jgi:hypothetical protein
VKKPLLLVLGSILSCSIIAFDTAQDSLMRKKNQQLKACMHLSVIDSAICS